MFLLSLFPCYFFFMIRQSIQQSFRPGYLCARMTFAETRARRFLSTWVITHTFLAQKQICDICCLAEEWAMRGRDPELDPIDCSTAESLSKCPGRCLLGLICFWILLLAAWRALSPNKVISLDHMEAGSFIIFIWTKVYDLKMIALELWVLDAKM